MGFLKDGFSLDEFKVSSIVVSFIILLGFAIYKYMTVGDITSNVVEILKIMVISIATVNGVKGISEITSNYRQIKQDLKEGEY